MTIYDWDDSFSAGIRQIDQHNQRLFALLKRLRKTVARHQVIPAINSELNDSLDYLVYHFACEEIWMIHTGYQFIVEHEKAHVQLRLKLTDVIKEIKNGSPLVSRVLPIQVKSLIVHIKQYDIPFGHFAIDRLSKRLMTHTHSRMSHINHFAGRQV